MKKNYLGIILFLCLYFFGVVPNIAAESNRNELNSFFIENLKYNNATSDECEFAYNILKNRKVAIPETQSSIDLTNNTLKKMFNIQISPTSTAYHLINALFKYDKINENGVQNLLDENNQHFLYFFPESVMEKNSNITVTDIYNYTKNNDIDTFITPKALDLIISDNVLKQVPDVFSDNVIHRISQLNSYAEKRSEYDENNIIDDKILKEFLDFANTNEDNKKAVNEALKNKNLEMYNYVKQEILKEKELAYQKKLQEDKALSEAKKKEKLEYYKKNFTSNETFMSNYFGYKYRDNKAFAIGLLNPINLVSAIICLPVYFVLWPLGQV